MRFFFYTHLAKISDMERLYTYYDYEEAFYHMQYTKCIEIGKYLLPKLKDKRAIKLLTKLGKVEYRWDLPKEDMDYLIGLLEEIRIWLMVWENMY